MCLVEGIVGKRQESVPECGDGRLRKLIPSHALTENFELLRQLFRLLLAHCPSKKVRLSKRVTSDFLCSSHHLLLVNNQTEGWTKNFLERLR